MFVYLTYFGRTQDGKLDDLSSEGHAKEAVYTGILELGY